MDTKVDAPGYHGCCPVCGLAWGVVGCGPLPTLSYDFAAWDQRCLHPGLGGPSMCHTRQHWLSRGDAVPEDAQQDDRVRFPHP